jgi:hypothetical protein
MNTDPNYLQKPCITLPIMLSLCKHFGVLPTYVQMMKQTPGFRLHVLDGDLREAKTSAGQWSHGKQSARKTLVSPLVLRMFRFLLCCTNAMVR